MNIPRGCMMTFMLPRVGSKEWGIEVKCIVSMIEREKYVNEGIWLYQAMVSTREIH